MNAALANEIENAQVSPVTLDDYGEEPGMEPHVTQCCGQSMSKKALELVRAASVCRVQASPCLTQLTATCSGKARKPGTEQPGTAVSQSTHCLSQWYLT